MYSMTITTNESYPFFPHRHTDLYFLKVFYKRLEVLKLGVLT